MDPTMTDRFCTSFAQQRLLFLDDYESGTSLYNIAAAWRLQGPLDGALLERSLNLVVDRHESLRTTFAPDGPAGEGGAQLIAAQLAVSIRMHDLSACADPEQQARAMAQAEARQSFDLGRGPLLRAQLLALGAQQHIFLLTLHHIVSDGWSMGVLMRELSLCYRALHAGTAPALAPLPIQYADFAVWQRDHLQGERLQTQLAYWQRTLDGAAAPLELPTDRPRPAVLTHRGAAVDFALDGALHERLRALAGAGRGSTFMVAAAALNVLLQRYTGQRDICIGYPVANRSAPDVQGLIGLFVNTLVLRTRIDDEHTFAALLQQVRDAVLDGDAHQGVPFERLVEALRPARHLNRTPLFQVMLSFYDAGAEGGLDLPGLSSSIVPVASTGAKFDLSVELMVRDGALYGVLEYNTDLFDHATIERIAGHYAVLLNAVAADPLCALKHLPMLGAAEQDQLRAWSGAAVPAAGGGGGVHLLFEQQAARTPGARALLWGAHCLSYGELDARANQLAHHLRALGVLPDTLVALCVERGPEMVVGMLAILKAGAAYVPLDPDYPPQRLAYMLDDCAATVLLTEQHLQARLPRRPAHTVCLDAERAAIACHPTYATGVATLGQQLAYCIYTSGSTGQPKGAVNTHAGVANLLHWYRHGSAGLGRADRVMLASSLSFDLTQKNILGTLAAGATLIIPDGPASDPDSFRRALQQHQPTHVNCAPSAWRAYAAGLTSHGALRSVVLGGEAIDAALAADLAGAGLDLVNSYGPTECADVALSYLNAAAAARTDVPLGRPIPGVQVYIVDGANQRVPAGVVGEICIGGAGVARGYWRRPELTAERFVPDPFGAPGSRMYRSGDLGRWLADGSIAFLGRLDHQVKLRGMRIEPGEIEAALLRCPGVRQALVMVREDQPGEQKLVAYVTPITGAGAPLEPAVLRAQLADSLPAYMLPGAWVVLDTLPLNPNGKTDRAALPAPDASHHAAAVTYVAPRSAQERRVAAIWATLLKLPQVGLQDNFFALGGHSLLAAKALAQIRQQLGVDIALKRFFGASTLSDLVAGLAGEPAAAPPAIVRVTRSDPVPASFAQQGLWFLDQYQPGGDAYNIPSAWRIHGALDAALLERSLNAVVERHEALRTSFALERGTPVQRIASALPLDLALLDLSARPDAASDARHLVRQEAAQPFDLARGPLIRTRLLKLAQDEHVFMLTLHHIIADGRSLGVLMDELGELYRAGRAGSVPALAPLPLQYADFAMWQRAYLQGARPQAQLAYWQATLGGAAPVLELPLDHPRPAVLTHRGAAVQFDLGPALTGRMQALARQRRGTLFMVAAAAFNALLHRYTGQSDVCIGYGVANRQHPGLDSLIGYFVNTLVLRTAVDAAQSFDALLGLVRDAVLDGDAHQDLPFERVVEALRPERRPGHSPLFQVALSFNHGAGGVIGVPGLTFERIDGALAVAKYDLTLVLAERDGTLDGAIEYNTALFEPATIEGMAASYVALLEAFAAHPQTVLQDVALPDADRRRQALHARLQAGPHAAAAGAPASEGGAPQGDLEQALAQIWTQVLAREQIGRNDNFFELGGHSMLAVVMLALVGELGHAVELAQLFANPTLRGLAALIDAPPAPVCAPVCLVPLRAGGSLAPLFLVQPHQEELGYASAVAAQLDAAIPLYGLAAPAGAVAAGGIAAMAQEFLAAMRHVQPQGPYRLAGWSAGGTIAYEMAAQLRAAGEPVAFLGLIDTSREYGTEYRRSAGAAHAGAHDFSETDAILLTLADEVPEAARDQLHALGASGEIDAMLLLCQQLGVLPAGQDGAALRAHLARRRALMAALYGYAPAPLDVPLTLFIATNEARTNADLGWGAIAGAQLDPVRLPATHQGIVRAPHAAALCRALAARLDTAALRAA
ncbi:amino acid adenylation domain-containing protein [Massilia cavernae]|uniref:Amino acid adenylation domain-containing protein n=2 Tax=Massilia cavernae TaxID=2320864 RepID=A0A418Y8V0_9BURK|nr:amino acid adenylation domain-containing protein [Massilia cavernae]